MSNEFKFSEFFIEDTVPEEEMSTMRTIDELIESNDVDIDTIMGNVSRAFIRHGIERGYSYGYNKGRDKGIAAGIVKGAVIAELACITASLLEDIRDEVIKSLLIKQREKILANTHAPVDVRRAMRWAPYRKKFPELFRTYDETVVRIRAMSKTLAKIMTSVFNDSACSDEEIPIAIEGFNSRLIAMSEIAEAELEKIEARIRIIEEKE